MRPVRLAALMLVVLAGCAGDDARVESSTQGTTTTVDLGGGRLHTPFFSGAYGERGSCLCDLKVEPGGDDITPAHTKERALDEIMRLDKNGWRAEGLQATVWFGIFAGNEMNPSAPDGRLTGVHWVTDVPAWLLIVHDTKRVSYGKGGPPTDDYTFDWAVFSDSDLSHPINAITSTGGEEPVLY